VREICGYCGINTELLVRDVVQLNILISQKDEMISLLEETLEYLKNRNEPCKGFRNRDHDKILETLAKLNDLRKE
jgi:hypothetical protein